MKLISRYFSFILLLIILIAFGWYAFRYIQVTSFVIDDVRYYNLFDDAMVSMRYAWNLAHGNGLVWNAGERVEGFTNPLWVFFMAFWHLLPIPSAQISLPIQISGAVFLALNLVFVYLIVRHLTDDLLAMAAALVMIAFYAPLNIWGLLGMEVSLLTLILTFSTWIVLTCDLSRWGRWLYLLLAFSTLIRIDAAVAAVLMIGFVAFTDRPNWKRHLAWGLGLLFLFLAVQTGLRYWYYGELLPNTYYLKMAGLSAILRIRRGIWVLFELAWQMNWVVFLLPLVTFIFRRDKSVFLLALLFAGQVAYSTYVGGDAWEHRGGANRFIATAIPLWFILFGVAVSSLRKAAETQLQLTGWKVTISHTIALFLLAFSVWNANLLLADYRSIDRWLFKLKPAYIKSHEKYVTTVLILEQITRPGARIAVTAAGTEAYLLPDRYFIDLLGKADKVIAREPIRSEMRGGIEGMRVGHMKWDYAYSIGKLKPDVIVQLWDEDVEGAQPYLGDYLSVNFDGLPLFLRKDSPLIIWENVK